MTEDTSPENLRKFLASDDPAMVRMGISMAKGVNIEITIEDIGHFLESEEVEKVKIGINLAEEAGVEKEAFEYFSKSVNDLVEIKRHFMIPTHKYAPCITYDEESLFEILESIAEDEKYTERIAEILANFLEDHFDGEKRTGETEPIYDDALVLLGIICNDKLREKHICVLVDGALRQAYKFPGYPESELISETCRDILVEWDKDQVLMDTAKELILDYLYDAISDGQPCSAKTALYEEVAETSEEELLENIPWEEAYSLLTDQLEDNYEERPEWTVSTLKACLRKSEHKEFRDEAKKALEELGIND